MKEDFLHYLWKFKKFNFISAKTTTGEEINLLATGQHNTKSSGPDFFNAQLRISGQKWAGNVEIHVCSSDWYAHKHETDPAYDNVILHVVWEHDIDVFRKDNSIIPCLELKSQTPAYALENYHRLLSVNKKWINCASDFNAFSKFKVQNWLERLYIERLEKKTVLIDELLVNSKNDWEAVLFQLLAKNFGLNKNGMVFLEMAQSIPFNVMRKINSNMVLEALFFGQLNFFQDDLQDSYHKQLKTEYDYLKQKYRLNPVSRKPYFFRLRPVNFPTIRLSQLAQVYAKPSNLFTALMKMQNLKEFYSFFNVETSDFWKTHYTFDKESKAKTKRLTQDFIDLLIINTVIPLKFAFGRHRGEVDFEYLFQLMRTVKGEKNSITKGFAKLRPGVNGDALSTQALIHLKSNYCDKNRCLECNLGIELLQK